MLALLAQAASEHVLVPLDNWDLVIVSACLLVNVVLSIRMQLGMQKTLLIAGLRTVVQLLAIGFVLQRIFAIGSALLVVLVLVLMTLLAGFAISGRLKRRFRGMLRIAIGSIMFPAFLMTAYAVTVVVRPSNPFDPHYLIPLMGMVLGNSLTAVSLSMDVFLNAMVERRKEVEAMLLFGATRSEATGPFTRDAVRTGMMPMINAMMVVGLVSLPGMMTGQILGGSPPAQAVRYQILVMFLLAGSTALGASIAVLWMRHALFDTRDRLRRDVVERRPQRSAIKSSRLSRTPPPGESS